MSYDTVSTPMGVLAASIGYSLPLQVLRSQAGYYIGTMSSEGPCSRESVEYYHSLFHADAALNNNSWTQRANP